MGEDMPYIYHITGCVSAIIPGLVEYLMTEQLTPLIAGGAGVAGGLLTYAILTWWHKRKAGVAPSKKRDTEKTVLPPLIQRSLLDRLVVLRNPGNHEAVIRLIVKGKTVEEIDLLFSNYINVAGYHSGYEVDAVRFWKKRQLQKDKDDRTKWYKNGRNEFLKRHGCTREQLDKALSDAAEKYPELVDARFDRPVK